MQSISIRYDPPVNGWLRIFLHIGVHHVVIDASDVPNNPVQELMDALDSIASGRKATVWWNLEPDGYFMHFEPKNDRINFFLEFSSNSDVRHSHPVVTAQGTAAEILLPFWRFLRDFQSRDYPEMHWPEVCCQRVSIIKDNILKER